MPISSAAALRQSRRRASRACWVGVRGSGSGDCGVGEGILRAGAGFGVGVMASCCDGDAPLQSAMMWAPSRSDFSGPMPEICWRLVRFCGAAVTMLRRTLSPKMMKAGLPVLAASALRHSRRRASRSFCAGVKGASVSCAALHGLAPFDCWRTCWILTWWWARRCRVGGWPGLLIRRGCGLRGLGRRVCR